jgi:hypothetical protein
MAVAGVAASIVGNCIYRQSVQLPNLREGLSDKGLLIPTGLLMNAGKLSLLVKKKQVYLSISMDLSSSREAISYAATRELPSML